MRGELSYWISHNASNSPPPPYHITSMLCRMLATFLPNSEAFVKYDKISIKIFKFFLFSVQVDYSDVYYIVNYTKIYSVKKSMISNRNAHVDNDLKNVSSGSLIFCDWVYFCIDIDFPSYRSKNQRCLSQLHRLMLYIYSYLSKPHPKLDTQCTGK